MIRTILEFLLSRSLDNNESPSPWLLRRLQQDRQLKQYRDDSQQLDHLLRRSAAKVRESMQTDQAAATLTLPLQRQTTAADSPHRLSVRWLVGLAAAALLLIALLPNWLRPSAPAVHAGEFSQQLTVVPGEVLRLLTQAAKTSQTQLPQLSPLSNFSLPELPDWEKVAQHVDVPVRQEFNAWQDSWRNIKFRLPDSSQEF